MNNKEDWGTIPGFGGVYEISTHGNVVSYHRDPKGRPMKTRLNKRGYLTCSLTYKNCRQEIHVGRLIALVFIPNPNNLPEILFKDGDKTNININNIEWCKHQDSIKTTQGFTYEVFHKDSPNNKQVFLSSIEVAQFTGLSKIVIANHVKYRNGKSHRSGFCIFSTQERNQRVL
jgi:hypothetical protein